MAEMSGELSSLIAKRSRIQIVLWVVVMASIFAYALVVHAATVMTGHAVNPLAMWLRQAIMGVGAIIACMSALVTRVVFSDERLQELLRRQIMDEELTGAATGEMPAAKLIALSPDDRHVYLLFTRYMTVNLLALVATEIPALIGIVLSISSGSVKSYLPFLFVSIIAVLFNFPRFGALLDKSLGMSADEDDFFKGSGRGKRREERDQEENDEDDEPRRRRSAERE